MPERVVITGIGAVTPIGIGKESFWNSLINGVSGVGEITSFDASAYSTRIAAEVKNFNPTDFVSKKELRKMDRFVLFAMAATKLAVEDAKLKLNNSNQDSIGVLVGSGIGGLASIEEQHKILLEKGPARISPFFIPMLIANMASGQISINLGVKGPNTCVVTACATGSHCIGDAFKIIQRGDADIIIAGGSEAAITPLGLAGFCAMKALSTRNDEPKRASRPFDRERDGFVMAEGAGIVIMESLKSAIKRDVPIYAEIIGYAMNADAYHITAPDPEGRGVAKAMELALKDAQITPDCVDYINAHGTSTELNDKLETIAIKKVFGEHAFKLAVSSTKSMTGHALGATGALEVIATALAIKEGVIPPTINYDYPDPECDLDYVPNRSRRQEVNIAISNSFGFGGHNAVIVLKKIKHG